MKDEQIISEIEKALRCNSETTQIEFKDARGGFPADPVAKTLSAFGNTKGGIIVFGIVEQNDRSLEIVGTEDVAMLQERMAQLSSEGMSEVLRLEYHILSMKEEAVLAVNIPECANHVKPYYIRKFGMDRGAFVRDGITDRQMTAEEVRGYVRNAQVDDFDGNCTEDAVLDDLSHDKLISLLKKSAEKAARDFEKNDKYIEVLENIGIVKKCKEELRPTIAGYLIFAKNRPQNKLQFQRYVIRCVRYKGSGVHSDIIDSLDIYGTLDEQIDGMQAFILRNIKKSAEIVGTKRIERYEYPEKAIREIVANAVIHRDYRITETYTQVNIFEDRIEVFNPGNLPLGVTIENIKNSQMSRNKIIAARLKDLDYLEEYGRGIDIVFTKMNEWGLLPPIFKNTSNSFRVILPGENLSKLNERQMKIWEYLVENGRITRKGAETLSIDTAQQTISSDLRKMKDIGLIRQIGESKDTFYEPCF
ncbi:MAG: ATP-binding protein [Candidatus Moranbacteria bacterium]|jgi:ATP-dependent DNA helicase RecG|nr:ATP-binding protein [Candidatus Moranbacteria bacterium]